MVVLRRQLRFSLNPLFVLATALAVWLGFVTERARQQRIATQAVIKLGGKIGYDWFGEDDVCHTPSFEEHVVRLRAWLARTVGDEFVYNVQEVYLPLCQSCDREILGLLPHLQRLRRLRVLWISLFTSEETERHLVAALPSCKVIRAVGRWR